MVQIKRDEHIRLADGRSATLSAVQLSNGAYETMLLPNGGRGEEIISYQSTSAEDALYFFSEIKEKYHVPELTGKYKKLLKIQKSSFIDENRELSREEYTRLVQTAERQGNQRLSLVLQTICATGIRVSELKFITVDTIQTGRAEIANKGKRRPVFLPEKLRRVLKRYIQKQKITAGAVFVTRAGKPLDRTNIWREMKGLCKTAGVEPGKVFPHNLRHLFARIYYTLEKDLSRLADILGHSSINTTRIYTAESGIVHARQVERMGLVLTT